MTSDELREFKKYLQKLDVEALKTLEKQYAALETDKFSDLTTTQQKYDYIRKELEKRGM